MPKQSEIEEQEVEARPRNISFFLKEKAAPPVELERVISDRFKDDKGVPVPFVVKALPASRARDLEKLAQRAVKTNGKVTGSETDLQKYMDLLIIDSCEFPDFSSAELIKSYGARNPEHLLNTMLTAGERTRLMEAVNEANGFDNEPLQELMDEAKNS